MILDKFSLHGKTAIVTGAAQGLGHGIAIGLAEAGANVALVDLLSTTETKKRIEVTNSGNQFKSPTGNPSLPPV